MNNLLFQWKLIFILKDNKYSQNVSLSKKVILKHKNISRKIRWLQDVKINVDEDENVFKRMLFFLENINKIYFFWIDVLFKVAIFLTILYRNCFNNCFNCCMQLPKNQKFNFVYKFYFSMANSSNLLPGFYFICSRIIQKLLTLTFWFLTFNF